MTTDKLTKEAFADFIDEIAGNLRSDFAGCMPLWEEMVEAAKPADLFPPLARSIPEAFRKGMEPGENWSAVLSAYAEGLRQGCQ